LEKGKTSKVVGESCIVYVYKEGDRYDCIGYWGISMQLNTKFYPKFFSQG
jgi:hypothetical protein